MLLVMVYFLEKGVFEFYLKSYELKGFIVWQDFNCGFLSLVFFLMKLSVQFDENRDQLGFYCY